LQKTANCCRICERKELAAAAAEEEKRKQIKFLLWGLAEKKSLVKWNYLARERRKRSKGTHTAAG
jgi:hypothetical protein